MPLGDLSLVLELWEASQWIEEPSLYVLQEVPTNSDDAKPDETVSKGQSLANFLTLAILELFEKSEEIGEYMVKLSLLKH